jgi:hypothetical protein
MSGGFIASFKDYPPRNKPGVKSLRREPAQHQAVARSKRRKRYERMSITDREWFNEQLGHILVTFSLSQG